VGVAEDITDLRFAEQQLMHAQKMEAVGQLAGGVAHDFNNVLTVILSYAQLMREDAPGNSQAADAQQIVDAVKHAQTLTRQLLAFSRQQVTQPVVLDPNEVIRGVEKMLRRLIGEDVELSLSLDGGGATVRADAGQLEQVLLNLAVNARDAMPRGGLLTVETRAVTLDAAAAAERGLAAPGRYMMIAVRDTGVGMSPEVQSRIFEAFFTTKEPGRGTGLGLATVLGIIKQCDGAVTVRSEPGQGAEFRLFFPAVEERAVARPLAPPVTVSGGQETILLTEDDPAVRRIATEILVRQGYTVLVAGHGEEALARARSHGGSVQLLLTDVVMPGMDGPTLANRLRITHPGVRTLFTSGYAGDAMAQRGMLESGQPFLEKPFTASQLLRKVREALDAGNGQDALTALA
jgi:nitrogen-specific signal transduction histidine kinase/ActR/RegA family two-component response regulator